jgi:hypothetical protein
MLLTLSAKVRSVLRLFRSLRVWTALSSMLGAQALSLPPRVDRPVVDAPCPFPHHPTPLAEAVHEAVDRQPSELLDGRDTHFMKGPFGGRANPVEAANW